MVKNRFSVKNYDDGLIAIFDSETFSYLGICDDVEDNKLLLDDVVTGFNELFSELVSCNDELVRLKRYLGSDKYELVLENIKLRNMVKYQSSVYELEKKYFSELLESCIDEYHGCDGLIAFRDVVDW